MPAGQDSSNGAGAATLRKIECLRPFMTDERFEALSRRIEERTGYMVMCLEDIYYPHNASAVIRSSEAFGIQQIHAVESIIPFSPSRDVVRGTDQWMDIRKWETTRALVGHLREHGYRIVVASPHEGGSTPDNFDLAKGRFSIFLGTERTGISEELMAEADDYIQIPMVGFAESLNISVSAAIIAQRLTTRLRESGLDWRLTPAEKNEVLLRWMKRTVKDAEGILKRKHEECLFPL